MRWYALFCAVLLLVVSGCARPSAPPQPPVPLDVLADTIQWARENIEALQHLPLKDADAEDFREAQEHLRLAEHAFEDALYDQAYFAALDSLAASQGILSHWFPEIAGSATVLQGTG